MRTDNGIATTLPCACLLSLFIGATAHSASTTIDFDDGFPHKMSAANLYNSAGLTMPNMRTHQASDPQATSFAFVDDWGIVINDHVRLANAFPGIDGFLFDGTPVMNPAPNGGTYSAFSGIFLFSSPVDFMTMDVSLQSGIGDTQSWNMRAFNALDQQVAFAVATLPNPGPDNFVDSSLTVSAAGQISLVVLNRTANIGVDTITFSASMMPVPAPAAVGLLAAALVVAGTRRRRLFWSR